MVLRKKPPDMATELCPDLLLFVPAHRRVGSHHIKQLLGMQRRSRFIPRSSRPEYEACLRCPKHFVRRNDLDTNSDAGIGDLDSLGGVRRNLVTHDDMDESLCLCNEVVVRSGLEERTDSCSRYLPRCSLLRGWQELNCQAQRRRCCLVLVPTSKDHHCRRATRHKPSGC